MSELSPAAFAVVDAFVSANAKKSSLSSNADIAAALRAAASHGAAGLTTLEYDTGWYAAMNFIDAIADELEAQ